jgi:hypothetical protein
VKSRTKPAFSLFLQIANMTFCVSIVFLSVLKISIASILKSDRCRGNCGLLKFQRNQALHEGNLYIGILACIVAKKLT